MPVDPSLIAFDLAGRLAVPSSNPHSFQPQVTSFIGQGQAAQHLCYTAGNLQISEWLALGIENEYSTFILIEISNR